MSLKQRLTLRANRACHRRLARAGPADRPRLRRDGARVLLSARKAMNSRRRARSCARKASMPPGSPPTARLRPTSRAWRSRPSSDSATSTSREQRRGDLGRCGRGSPRGGWDKVMNLNIRGVFLLTQAIGKACMIPRRYGRIVNVASIAACWQSARTDAHDRLHTSKGALVNFTRALASEWGRYNITVNALAPGFFPPR